MAKIKQAVETSLRHMADDISSSGEALRLLSEVTLVSCDGQPFAVEEEVVLKSLTVKQLIEDRKIPLPVTSSILSKVIGFCKGDFDIDFVQVDRETLSELEQAAQFLEIPSLRDLTTKAVADMRKSVKQYKVPCPNEQSKREMVVALNCILAGYDTIQQTIVFVQTWSDAMELHNTLVSERFLVGNTHAAPTQEDRDSVVDGFKEVATHVVITSDEHIAGFDFYQQEVNVIVNYDLPVKVKPDGSSSEPDCDVYVQRVDRAGRFGKTTGAVFNLLFEDDIEEEMMDKIGRDLTSAQKIGQITEAKRLYFAKALRDAGLFPFPIHEYSNVEDSHE